MRIPRIPVLVLVVLLCSGALAAQLRQIAILEIPGRPGFDWIAFAAGKVVIAHPGAGTVDIFDPVKRRILAQVKGLQQPRGIAVDEQADKVYVGDAGANSIAVLATGDWQVERTIPLDIAPNSLLFVPELQTLFVTSRHSDALVAIASDGKTVSVATGGRPQDMAFDPARKALYVAVQDRNEVAVVTPAITIAKRYRLQGSLPTGMAFDPAAGKIFVAVRYAVLVLDAESGREVGRVPVGAGADRLWFDDSTRSLYAATGGGAVTMIREQGGRYAAEQELVTQVRGHTLAFDAVRKLVYVPGGRDGRSKLVILKRLENATPPSDAQARLR